jgi:hypothetical protein
MVSTETIHPNRAKPSTEALRVPTVPEHFRQFSIFIAVPKWGLTQESHMFRKLLGAAAVAAFAIGTSVSAASADSCSGHDHVGGTVIGGVTGGVIGGAVTHGSVGGVVGGAVLGGLAGNQIARSSDCHRHRHYARYYYDRYGHKHYYRTAYGYR